MSTTRNIIEGIKNVTSEGVTKAQVGLGNVDNTADANKPISTATQTALNLKADTSTLNSQVWDYSQMPVGSVLQVVHNDFNIGDGGSILTFSSTSFVSTSISSIFTPKLSTSKILVECCFNTDTNTTTSNGILSAIYRDGTNISTGGFSGGMFTYSSPTSDDYQMHIIKDILLQTTLIKLH